MGNFEDIVIFVTDMEKASEKLDAIEKRLIAMNVLEEYMVEEVARLLDYDSKTIRRLLGNALDQLSQILLVAGLMDELPLATQGVGRCQEDKNYKIDLSNTTRAEYKYRKNVQPTLPDLIF